MTVLPVIERELRAQSRLAFTYNLRVVGAAAVLLDCVWYSFSQPLSHGVGGQLFSRLNCTLFLSIWILGPMLCADCISRERREGTVGLLFLTPLNARDVVLAKGLVHGLRALSLLLAVLPIITIALLLGGVGWTDAVLSLEMNFSALCWALAAGVLASSFSKTWLRSQLLAFTLVGCFGLAFLMVNGFNIAWLAQASPWIPYSTATQFDQILVVGFLGATNYNQWWGHMLSRLPGAASSSWLLAQGRMVILSILFLLLAVLAAAGNLRRFWREEPPSARRVWLEKKLFTPVLMVSFLHRWMQRKLERNPIGWLEARTWSGRLVMWGWFAVMVSIYTAALSNVDVNHSLDVMQRFMAWLLLGIIAVSAAGSFQRERETGVLELLLVSPMTVGQIIGGRLRGLWGQFLPAFGLLLIIWAFLSGFFPGRQITPGLVQYFCGAFLTLPVIGLYYSLRRSSFIVAFLSTVFTGMVIPFGIQMVLNVIVQALLASDAVYIVPMARPQFDDSLGTLLIYAVLRLIWFPFFITIVQLVIAAWVGRRLYRGMARREFGLVRVGA